MRAIILAAGQGTRLRPLTDDRPKALVTVKGKPIIEHAIGALAKAGVSDVCIVTGYRQDQLTYLGKTLRHNERFETTNMVHSLFCADDLLKGDDDVLVVYGDIIFRPSIIEALAADAAPLSVAINTKWYELWKERMEDPLSDAETLKLDGHGNITELGKRPKTLADVQGQYTGLIKFGKQVLPKVREFYGSLDRAGTYDGKKFDQMFMTSFLQQIIDRLSPIKAVLVDGGWLEVDSPQDRAHAEGAFERIIG